MEGIADTGFVVAFIRNSDQHHRWAVDLAKQVMAPLLTCEAVLAESAFHLKSCETVLHLIENELLQVAFDCTSHWQPLQELANRYADRRPDFADLCLVRMSELYPRHPIITVDEADFRVYRRNKREAIPLICPPSC
jgi:predicted nucleic acid-binding protein